MTPRRALILLVVSIEVFTIATHWDEAMAFQRGVYRACWIYVGPVLDRWFPIPRRATGLPATPLSPPPR